MISGTRGRGEAKFVKKAKERTGVVECTFLEEESSWSDVSFNHLDEGDASPMPYAIEAEEENGTGNPESSSKISSAFLKGLQSGTTKSTENVKRERSPSVSAGDAKADEKTKENTELEKAKTGNSHIVYNDTDDSVHLWLDSLSSSCPLSHSQEEEGKTNVKNINMSTLHQELHPGDKVQIRGFQKTKNSHLNGQRASLESFDESSHKWLLQLEASQKKIKLKPNHFQLQDSHALHSSSSSSPPNVELINEIKEIMLLGGSRALTPDEEGNPEQRHGRKRHGSQAAPQENGQVKKYGVRREFSPSAYHEERMRTGLRAPDPGEEQEQRRRRKRRLPRGSQESGRMQTHNVEGEFESTQLYDVEDEFKAQKCDGPGPADWAKRFVQQVSTFYGN